MSCEFNYVQGLGISSGLAGTETCVLLKGNSGVWHLMRVIAVLVDKVDRGDDQVPVWAGTTQGAGRPVGTTQHADSPDKVKAALGLFVLELVLCYLCVLML